MCGVESVVMSVVMMPFRSVGMWVRMRMEGGEGVAGPG